jgi:hypothetical protein
MEKEYKIYKNSKDFLKALKKAPKKSVLIFDEGDLFPYYLKKTRAKSDKALLKQITSIIDFYRNPRGFGYHIKADIEWDKFRKKLEKRIKEVSGNSSHN